MAALVAVWACSLQRERPARAEARRYADREGEGCRGQGTREIDSQPRITAKPAGRRANEEDDGAVQEANEEVNKSIGAFLSKDQIHRLHQIQHQVQGPQAFTDEHVQNRLKLTDSSEV